MEIRNRMFPRARRATERLAVARALAETDLATFGARLREAERHPGRCPADPALEGELRAAREAHRDAAGRAGGVRSAGELSDVIATIAEGRRRLSHAEARLAGEAVLDTRLPCFFDPGHGPAATVVRWTPARHGTHLVPSCALDASRLATGREPVVRRVEVAGHRVAYWDGGEETSVYLDAYFGADPSLAWLHPPAQRARGGTTPPAPFLHKHGRPLDVP